MSPLRRTSVPPGGQSRIARRRDELRILQGYWSGKARDQRLLTEEELARYIAE